MPFESNQNTLFSVKHEIAAAHDTDDLLHAHVDTPQKGDRNTLDQDENGAISLLDLLSNHQIKQDQLEKQLHGRFENMCPRQKYDALKLPTKSGDTAIMYAAKHHQDSLRHLLDGLHPEQLYKLLKQRNSAGLGAIHYIAKHCPEYFSTIFEQLEADQVFNLLQQRIYGESTAAMIAIEAHPELNFFDYLFKHVTSEQAYQILTQTNDEDESTIAFLDAASFFDSCNDELQDHLLQKQPNLLQTRAALEKYRETITSDLHLLENESIKKALKKEGLYDDFLDNYLHQALPTLLDPNREPLNRKERSFFVHHKDRLRELLEERAEWQDIKILTKIVAQELPLGHIFATQRPFLGWSLLETDKTNTISLLIDQIDALSSHQSIQETLNRLQREINAADDDDTDDLSQFNQYQGDPCINIPTKGYHNIAAYAFRRGKINLGFKLLGFMHLKALQSDENLEEIWEVLDLSLRQDATKTLALYDTLPPEQQMIVLLNSVKRSSDKELRSNLFKKIAILISSSDNAFVLLAQCKLKNITALMLAAKYSPSTLEVIFNHLTSGKKFELLQLTTHTGMTTVMYVAKYNPEYLRVIFSGLDQKQKFELLQLSTNTGMTAAMYAAKCRPDCPHLIFDGLLREDKFTLLQQQNKDGVTPLLHLLNNNRIEKDELEQYLHSMFKNMTSKQKYDLLKLPTKNGDIAIMYAAKYHPDSLITLLEKLSKEQLYELSEQRNDSGLSTIHYIAIHCPENFSAIFNQLEPDQVFSLLQQRAYEGSTAAMIAIKARPEINFFNSLFKHITPDQTYQLLSQINHKGESAITWLKETSFFDDCDDEHQNHLLKKAPCLLQTRISLKKHRETITSDIDLLENKALRETLEKEGLYDNFLEKALEKALFTLLDPDRKPLSPTEKKLYVKHKDRLRELLEKTIDWDDVEMLTKIVKKEVLLGDVFATQRPLWGWSIFETEETNTIALLKNRINTLSKFTLEISPTAPRSLHSPDLMSYAP